jgi:hypothetical protein
MGKNTGVWVLSVLVLAGSSMAAADEQPQLAHAVYFTLKDRTDEAREQLVQGCKQLLAGHPGTVYFAAGVLAEEFDREVNDRGFDVALLIVFQNKEAHDTYQVSPRHNQFIERYKDLWQTVRVFDSYQTAMPDQPAQRPKRPATPKKARN